MNVIFSATPARKTEFGFQCVFKLDGTDPRQSLAVENLKDLLAKFEVFKSEMDATGKPYQVSFMQHPRDAARKFPGFKKAAEAVHYTPSAYTVTETELKGY